MPPRKSKIEYKEDPQDPISDEEDMSITPSKGESSSKKDSAKKSSSKKETPKKEKEPLKKGSTKKEKEPAKKGSAKKGSSKKSKAEKESSDQESDQESDQDEPKAKKKKTSKKKSKGDDSSAESDRGSSKKKSKGDDSSTEADRESSKKKSKGDDSSTEADQEEPEKKSSRSKIERPHPDTVYGDPLIPVSRIAADMESQHPVTQSTIDAVRIMIRDFIKELAIDFGNDKNGDLRRFLKDEFLAKGNLSVMEKTVKKDKDYYITQYEKLFPKPKKSRKGSENSESEKSDSGSNADARTDDRLMALDNQAEEKFDRVVLVTHDGLLTKEGAEYNSLGIMYGCGLLSNSI